MKTENQLHAKRRGWLKNGNPPGDFSKAPRCMATTRQKTPCQSPAMKNGRCRMHGGGSTGPKTAEGLRNSQCGNLKHGLYSREAIRERRVTFEIIRQAYKLIKSVE